MKTKDIIKILQELDPDGENIVTVENNAILSISKVSGYYNGPYQHYDNKGVLSIISSGDKILIGTIDKEDIIWGEEGDMEKIKKRIKINLDSYVNKEEETKNIWSKIEELALEVKGYSDNINLETKKSVIKKYKSGWKVILPKQHKNIHMDIRWKKGLIKERVTIGEVYILNDDKIFEKVEGEKYITFKLIENDEKG
jgi:hypothetical protein